MAVFKFSLASVLRLREHGKNERRWELRSLYRSRYDVLVEIERLDKRFEEETCYPAENQIVTAYELALLAEHGRQLTELIKKKRVLLGELEKKIIAKRAELVDAMRAVKSLEQLRSRQLERHWQAQNRAQQRFTDEVAQRKFVQGGGRKKVPD
jgi:flagellar export protein FliJ